LSALLSRLFLFAITILCNKNEPAEHYALVPLAIFIDAQRSIIVIFVQPGGVRLSQWSDSFLVRQIAR
jgi:hypothetical protein